LGGFVVAEETGCKIDRTVGVLRYDVKWDLHTSLRVPKVPGSVPALADIIPPYSGEYMVPFEGNFHLGGM